MTTITLQLDEALLERVQNLAAKRQSTLDEVVAEQLELARSVHCDADLAEEGGASARRFKEAMARFAIYETGAPYTREALNER